MSFLNELINSEIDEVLREELQDRLAIVTHKIMYMDKVPVICLTANNEIQPAIQHLIETAGGQLVDLALEAKVVIYFDYQKSLGELIGQVPALLEEQWPAVTYNRVYLIDDSLVLAKMPSDWLALLEDIAEILHPGFFVFGNEGKNWINFGV